MIALKTEIWVKAHIKRLSAHGIGAYIVHHGDDTSGDLLIKLNTLDGSAKLFQRIYNFDTDDRDWTSILVGNEEEIDLYINKQRSFDADLWVMEIEDGEGRHFLDLVSKARPPRPF